MLEKALRLRMALRPQASAAAASAASAPAAAPASAAPGAERVATPVYQKKKFKRLRIVDSDDDDDVYVTPSAVSFVE